MNPANAVLERSEQKVEAERDLALAALGAYRDALQLALCLLECGADGPRLPALEDAARERLRGALAGAEGILGSVRREKVA